MMTMTISCYFWWIPFVCFLLSEKNVDRYFLFVKKWSSHIQNDYSFQRIQTTNTVMEFHYKKKRKPWYNNNNDDDNISNDYGEKKKKRKFHIWIVIHFYSLSFFRWFWLLDVPLIFFERKEKRIFFTFQLFVLLVWIRS